MREPYSMQQALNDCLVSPNESDSNFEPANVVDGLFALARAIKALALANEKLALAIHSKEQ